MKKLFVVRHAKSSWENFSVADIDRPLNDRGKRDAPEMAGRLLKKSIEIDRFISSNALRAKTTAEIFRQSFKNPEEVLIIPRLYEAGPENFYEVISAFDDKISSAAIFSHNPGITAFVNSLTPVRVDDMPTCAIYAITVKADKWEQFRDAEKEFLLFDYPKSDK